jgi:ectoine hydroxylase-related dioxygenase (phytanoyl-CoA dioxygenase family)
MQAVVNEIADQITVPTLNKGDALFWNSGTIHGSIEGRDPTRTRRSPPATA